jgi:hypothetical protein
MDACVRANLNRWRIAVQTLSITHNQRARDVIARFDFSPVLRRALSKGMPPHTADIALEQLKLFLIACAEHPNTDLAPPSSACDEVWHEFIVADTRSYCRFCDAVYGEYLHHNGATVSPERLTAARQNSALLLGLPATVDCLREAQGADCLRDPQGADCLREAAAPDCLREAAPTRV